MEIWQMFYSIFYSACKIIAESSQERQRLSTFVFGFAATPETTSHQSWAALLGVKDSKESLLKLEALGWNSLHFGKINKEKIAQLFLRNSINPGDSTWNSESRNLQPGLLVYLALRGLCQFCDGLYTIYVRTRWWYQSQRSDFPMNMLGNTQGRFTNSYVTLGSSPRGEWQEQIKCQADLDSSLLSNSTMDTETFTCPYLWQNKWGVIFIPQAVLLTSMAFM